MGPSHSLDLRLLGAFEARCDEQPFAVANRKAWALLAYLAMPAGRIHQRESLATLFWGELSADRARGNLRSAIFALRRVPTPSGVAWLCAKGDTVFLDPAKVRVDVADFERALADGSSAALAGAVALYRGDFLDGLIVDEPPVEYWLRNQRQRLHERAVHGLNRLLACREAERDSEAAIETALRLLALDPLQESVQRTLMRLYAEAGRPGAAREQYRAGSDLLRRELGVEPEAETRSLYEQLLRDRGTVRAEAAPGAGRSVVRPETVAPAAIAADPGATPLIGRDAELSQLRQAFQGAVGGEAKLVVIVGASGIGKTRLLTEFAAETLGQGCRILWGRAFEAEQVLPFGPWIDALRSADIAADGQTLAALGAVWRDELARLLPELRRTASGNDSEFDHLRVFECISRLITVLSERQPLGVLLDDMHWSDSMSLRLLAYLARHPPGERCLLAIAVREEELADATILHRLIADLEHEKRAVRLAVAPLSRADTLSLVDSLAPPLHELGGRIWTTTEGNPFMVVESVRALVEIGASDADERQVPLRVSDILAGRLDRLTKQGGQLAASGAVIGREFGFALLRLVAGLDEAEAVEGVEELVRRRILHGVGARFDFTHDAIRQVAYDRLLPPRRKLLHRRAAEALEGVLAATPGATSAAIARHYLAAEIWPGAARHSRLAGAEAVAQSAYREAVPCLEQALATAAHLGKGREAAEHTIDTRRDLYRALMPSGRPERLLGVLREAEAEATSLGDRTRLGWITAYTANCLWLSGLHAVAAEAAGRALEIAAALDDLDLRIVANFHLGQTYHFAGRYRDAVDVFARNLEWLGDDHARERFGLPGSIGAISRGWLCWSLAELGAFGEAIAQGQQALAIAETADHPFSLLDACRELGCLYIRLGDIASAAALLERGLGLAQSRDMALWLPSFGSALGYAYASSGRHHEGTALLEAAVEQASALGVAAGQALRLAWLAEAHLLNGDSEKADAVARQAVELSTRHDERGNRACALRMVGEIALRRPEPDLEAAGQALSAALLAAESLGMRPLAAQCRLGSAELSARLGRREHAETERANAASLLDEMRRSAGLQAPAIG